MRERERERTYYDFVVDAQKTERDRSYTGQVVVRGKDCFFQQGRQGLTKPYLKPSVYSGDPITTCVDGWNVFIQVVDKHSGKHRHQGGLVIYIMEGEGHSIVDGERLDWEAGDLMLLPLKPGGCEHQHFNKYEDQPVKWLAFIHVNVYQWGASEMVSLEKHPDYKG